jgi:hypothetical protein
MRSSYLIVCAAIVTVVAPATAQNPDSLAQEFIEFGIHPGRWNPSHAFPDCRAEPWAMDAIRRIADADLSVSRRWDLGIMLGQAFAGCGIPELEEWYFAEMVRLASDPRLFPTPFWDGIGHADNPRVRAKLYEWMSSDELPSWFREQSAGFYFAKFKGEEKIAAFAEAYGQGHVPVESAGLAISRLMHAHPEATVTRLGPLAREQPERFLHDPAFEILFILDLMREVPLSARVRFLDDVRIGMQSPAITPQQRTRLEWAVARIEGLGPRR